MIFLDKGTLLDTAWYKFLNFLSFQNIDDLNTWWMKLKIQEPENCPGRTCKADINK